MYVTGRRCCVHICPHIRSIHHDTRCYYTYNSSRVGARKSSHATLSLSVPSKAVPSQVLQVSYYVSHYANVFKARNKEMESDACQVSVIFKPFVSYQSLCAM
jgi:hypothetical protein